jgi:hypothetical protein
MSINQRQHIRFSLDLPATLVTKFGDRQETILQQISIGGCFTGWEENIYPGDEFRLEIDLPNGNRLPVTCRAIYRFDDTGIGVRFSDISRFEQDLISSVIADRLANEGLPMEVDPFSQPAKTIDREDEGEISDPALRDKMLAEAMTPVLAES